MARGDGIFRPNMGDRMKLRYDPAADAIYFRLDESPIEASEQVQPGVILDFNRENQLVGIEILDVKRRVPAADLTNVQFEVR
jgi:uncharacterized protein YuzE